jgi:hypothetical protein
MVEWTTIIALQEEVTASKLDSKTSKTGKLGVIPGKERVLPVYSAHGFQRIDSMIRIQNNC